MMGCALLCPGLCLFQHLEPTRTRWRDDHTGTMTKAEDNKEEDTATGTDRPQGCCECKFHAFSPTLPLDHMLLARGRSLLSTQRIRYLPKKNCLPRHLLLDSPAEPVGLEGYPKSAGDLGDRGNTSTE